MPRRQRKTDVLRREGIRNFSTLCNTTDHSVLSTQTEDVTIHSDTETIDELLTPDVSVSKASNKILETAQEIIQSTASFTYDNLSSSPEISLISSPYHPDSQYMFKRTKCGSQMRSCLSKWFSGPPPNGFPWLRYRPETDTVICYLNNYNKGTIKDVANILVGFSNWKKAAKRLMNTNCRNATIHHIRKHCIKVRRYH